MLAPARSNSWLRVPKKREVGGVERIDSLDAVRLHGGDDLQIEHVAAGHWMTAEQVEQPAYRLRRNGSTWRKASWPASAVMASAAVRGFETRRGLVTME